MPTLLIPVAGEVATVAPVIDHVNLVTAQLSAVVGFAMACDLAQIPAVVVVVTLAGHVMVGMMLSFTVTVKEHVAMFPAASLALYVTVVTPPLNVLVPTLLMPVTAEFATVAPAKAHVKIVTEQLSAVVAFGVAIDLVHVPAATVFTMFAGHVMVGRILSVTVTVYEHVAMLFAASATV